MKSTAGAPKWPPGQSAVIIPYSEESKRTNNTNSNNTISTDFVPYTCLLSQPPSCEVGKLIILTF